MSHSAVVPLPPRIRAGLDLLFALLLAYAVVRAVVVAADTLIASLVVAACLAALYVAERLAGSIAAKCGWIVGVSAVWIVFVVLVPEAAYLVLPLFFLYLGVLPGAWGPVAVVASTLVAIGALGFSGGFTLGGVVGPLVGAGIALLVGAGYRVLVREVERREAALAQLASTRARLARVERELAEARAERETHR